VGIPRRETICRPKGQKRRRVDFPFTQRQTSWGKRGEVKDEGADGDSRCGGPSQETRGEKKDPRQEGEGPTSKGKTWKGTKITAEMRWGEGRIWSKMGKQTPSVAHKENPVNGGRSGVNRPDAKSSHRGGGGTKGKEWGIEFKIAQNPSVSPSSWGNEAFRIPYALRRNPLKKVFLSPTGVVKSQKSVRGSNEGEISDVVVLGSWPS